MTNAEFITVLLRNCDPG